MLLLEELKKNNLFSFIVMFRKPSFCSYIISLSLSLSIKKKTSGMKMYFIAFTSIFISVKFFKRNGRFKRFYAFYSGTEDKKSEPKRKKKKNYFAKIEYITSTSSFRVEEEKRFFQRLSILKCNSDFVSHFVLVFHHATIRTSCSWICIHSVWGFVLRFFLIFFLLFFLFLYICCWVLRQF